MNPELEFLYQKWHETGTLDDEQLYLKAAAACGFLTRERIQFAGDLGHAPAQGLFRPVELVPEHFRSMIEAGCGLLTHGESIRLALECAKRALPAWTAIRPYDERPARAISATQDWLSNRATTDAVGNAAKGASDAGTEADDPELVPGDVQLTAAINAATSASHASLAAEYSAKVSAGLDPGVGDVEECVGWTLKFASDAANNRDQERVWQVERLIQYLLKRAGNPVP